MMKHTFFFGLCLSVGLLSAQSADQPIRLGSLDAEVAERMARDIEYLASDALEGRQPGTRGAEQARDYISEAFLDLGILPFFPEGYFQTFATPRLSELPHDHNQMSLGRKKLLLGEGYSPLPYSSTGSAAGRSIFVGTGIVSEAHDVNDYEGKDVKDRVVVILLKVSDEMKALVGPDAGFKRRITEAKSRGAKGVLFIMPHQPRGEHLPVLRSKYVADQGIPAALVSDRKWSRKLMRGSKKVTMSCGVYARVESADNVIGVMDFGAPQTVVIGAHYDHVGYGREGGASDRNRIGEIHNGADDNASGTTVLLELARQISMRPELQQRNYIFAAFSGEEDGLAGSKKFNGPDVDLSRVEYMINLDMVGRLSQNDSLTIYATGSAEQWSMLIDGLGEDSYVIGEVRDLFPRSDHASFIRNGIPAVMFFTGFHDDYHSPDDDFDLIDTPGMVTVVETALELIRRAQNIPDIVFINPAEVE